MTESFLSLFDPGPTSRRKLLPSANRKLDVSKSNLGATKPTKSDESQCPTLVEERGLRVLGELDGENLPPEPEQGNVEYKLKLLNPSKTRFEHLVTQMKWRLREGQGEAIYEIGVEDSGLVRGLSRREMAETLSTLNQMAERLGANTMILREWVVANGRTAKTLLIRKVPDDQQMLQITVAVMGNADAGKSSLLGVLIQDELDDGKGKARLNMLRHLHEIESGRTSSINHELLGFDHNGNAINYKEGTPETICELSSKLVTLIDLAGHQKYLRTTIHGVAGYNPHYLIFVVSASVGFTTMTKEHLTWALALEIPLIVVVTKIDVATIGETKKVATQLSDYLKYKKRVVRLHTMNDVIHACSNQPSEIDVPIVFVSNVTGIGIDLLKRLLFLLPPRLSSSERQRLELEPLEFQIDETFRIPEIGLVVGGLLTQGVVSKGASLILGPFADGGFKAVKVKSIQRHKISQRQVKASQSASLALEDLDADVQVRPGMVLISPFVETNSCLYFQATITVLYHSTAIRKGFQTTVHIGSIRQTATVHLILSTCCTLATNDEARVIFRFLTRPEYVKVGSRLLFREGQTKGLGTVVKVYGTKSSEHNFANEIESM